MRIALLTWGVRPGAFANLARTMARDLREAGAAEVLVAYLGRGQGSELGNGVRPVPLGARRTATSIIRIARFLQREAPDVLISMPTLMNVPAVVASLLVARRHSKVVVYQADTLGSDFRIDHRFVLRMRALPVLARLLYPHADEVVAMVGTTLDLLRAGRISTAGQPLGVIPPPVDLEQVRARSLEGPSHPWLVDKTQSVITSLGRLVKRKNLPLLLEAFARLRRRMPARLIVFGEGPERALTERLVAELGLDHVSLPGYVENPFADIACSDVFVMASLDEGFCLALVEAMACGVPVVATDAAGGGPRFILDHGRYGALVRSGDASALEEAVSQVLIQPDLARRRGQLARGRAAVFEPREIGGRWITFLEQVLST
ncbi:MAG: glycosyltransferase [Acidimicrobiia bacterium]